MHVEDAGSYVDVDVAAILVRVRLPGTQGQEGDQVDLKAP